MAAKQEFASRLAKHRDELEWLFMELYQDRTALHTLEAEMEQAWTARSAELKALDKTRTADPAWYKRGNMFGMTMYTDLFAGNLKGLAKKLPYLKEQKLTYLHLMPLLQMPHPHNDGGYAVEDFDTVDPALGTNKDLENLTRELRRNGISLCLDFVMAKNLAASFQGARQGTEQGFLSLEYLQYAAVLSQLSARCLLPARWICGCWRIWALPSLPNSA